MYLTIKQIKVNDKTYWIPVRSGFVLSLVASESKLTFAFQLVDSDDGPHRRGI